MSSRLELAHPDELHERHDAVRQVADVVPEHADELLARLLHPLEVGRSLAELVLQLLREDGAAHAGRELDRLERLCDVVAPADLASLPHALRTLTRGDRRDRAQ